jgi:hypothetical protein
MAIKLTQVEANALIDMLKNVIEQQTLLFPNEKGRISFEVMGERRTDEFIVDIDRKGINAQGCTYQGRIKHNNIVLLRLDVNPTSIHINSLNGEKFKGTHLHIYSEESELKEAIPFDIESSDLYGTCYLFFKKFNIIEKPTILYQFKFGD